MVTGLHAGNGRADFGHYAGAFVAEHNGGRVGEPATHNREVGVTHTARRDANPHLVGTGWLSRSMSSTSSGLPISLRTAARTLIDVPLGWPNSDTRVSVGRSLGARGACVGIGISAAA